MHSLVRIWVSSCLERCTWPTLNLTPSSLLWQIYLTFWSLIGSYLYFNATVVTQDGEKIKVREAVGNFFRSPHWAKAKQSFWKLYEEYQHEGWEGVKRRLTILSDLEGEERSLEIFNVTKEATMQEIKERYRVLAKQWHPDHHKDKEYAQEKFMEIQESYETLKKIRARREERTHTRARTRTKRS